MNDIIKLNKGNPGALTCLMGLMNDDNIIFSLPIMLKLMKCNIVGTDIYVLWSDLANKDYTIMAKLCKDVPDDILIDACSRQDYSGRELIKEYLN